MKKGILIALCVLLFFAAVGGGLAYLLLTPRGNLRSDSPDAVMAGMLEDLDRDSLRGEFARLCAPEVSEFEDAETVAGHLFDAAAADGSFAFRPVPGTEDSRSQDYIISCGDADLLTAKLSYSDGGWSGTIQGLDALGGVSRTLEITVPEGSAVSLNGKPVGEEYISQRDLLYPDMTELELRFESYPTLVRYEIGGIYETAELSAQPLTYAQMLGTDAQSKALALIVFPKPFGVGAVRRMVVAVARSFCPAVHCAGKYTDGVDSHAADENTVLIQPDEKSAMHVAFQPFTLVVLQQCVDGDEALRQIMAYGRVATLGVCGYPFVARVALIVAVEIVSQLVGNELAP